MFMQPSLCDIIEIVWGIIQLLPFLYCLLKKVIILNEYLFNTIWFAFESLNEAANYNDPKIF